MPTGNDVILSNNVHDTANGVFFKLDVADSVLGTVVGFGDRVRNAARNVASSTFGANCTVYRDGLICYLLTVLFSLSFVSCNVFIFMRTDCGISR